MTAATQLRVLERIDEVPARQWNALCGDYPFLRHEFLAALEHTGCVSARTGWTPQHLLLYDAHGLAAAAPLYRKEHSWGEFVFDFAWARAAQQRGLAYYPKLVCAVPFTPATGPRLLSRADLPAAPLHARLLECMRAEAESGRVSSVHGLFLDEAARAAHEQAGWLLRRDCHFQWHNHDYRDFEDFLQRFSADKRKKARRERRRVAEQGIEFLTLHGDELDEPTIERVHAFHALTFMRHGHVPYLNRACFSRIAHGLGARFVVKLARHGPRPIAAAVFLRSRDTLYGRYWGAEEAYHSLHFETCYYQGIDYCIEHGLARFEPGTQGEHKLARGFTPAFTWSAHWIADRPLRRAIAAYLAREGAAIQAYASEAEAHAPYKSLPRPAAPPEWPAPAPSAAPAAAAVTALTAATAAPAVTALTVATAAAAAPTGPAARPAAECSGPGAEDAAAARARPGGR
ncbi:MAG TPA: GNAT family N-acetyltransferase [Steroidobacteraceae bacterium]|nr:GNAT family N-acetyltransferase [Steroidobacteraceae bacterium]